MSARMSVMISCGEASGDLYAGALVAEMTRLDATVDVFGFGGSRFAAAGAELIDDYHAYSVTGLSEVLRVLPRSYGLYRRLVREARARRPAVFVAIDFPDFNFRLGHALHSIGIPVVYYISPQLWAWRPGRIETMRRFVDLVLPIFPFETAMYRDAGMAVEFVGHPLIDLIDPPVDRAAFLRRLGLDPARPTIALLPGSRPNELAAILGDLMAAARLIADRIPGAQFVLARAPNLDDHLLAPAIAVRDAGTPPLAIVLGGTDAALASADVVVTASGTATVQTALHERPMVIVYRVSAASYWLGRRFVKVDTFGMPNLIAGRRIVPELIQDGFTPEAVAGETIRLLTDRAAAEAMRADLRDVRRRLGAPGASRRAAEAVLRVARSIGVGAALVVALCAAAPAHAQPASGREPGRFEASVGAGWWGGYDLGSTRAAVPGQSGTTLFDASASIGGGADVTGRFAWTFWRTIAVEGAASFARARLRSTVTSDVEPALNASLDTPFNQLAGEAGLVLPLPRAAFLGGRMVPFVGGGGGYLRQLYQDGVLLETGRLAFGGGGVRFALSGARADRFLKRVGLRADVRLVVRTGGIDVDEKARAFVTFTGGAFVRF